MRSRRMAAREKLLDEQAVLPDVLQFLERDRRLLAYEIHDGLVQEVTGAKMHLEALLHGTQIVDRTVRTELELAVTLLRRAVVEARQLITGLRPPLLDELGLVPALSCLIDDLPPGGPVVRLFADLPPGRLDTLLEGTVYRIVQEAITNLRRHSHSDRAEVHLVVAGNQLHVEIRDWGVGFDPGLVEGKRFGIKGICERAHLLHGEAAIDSAPGKGTGIMVVLPLDDLPEEVASINETGVLNEHR